jgi:hypothetical protein
MKTRTIAVATVAFLAVTTGCLDDSITGTRPLSMTLSADVTAPAVGQNVIFTYTATGTALSQVELDYRDGETETRTYLAPLMVTDLMSHAFTVAGTYVVVGRASAAGGTVGDSLTITVN